jgi:hypothetical protein
LIQFCLIGGLFDTVRVSGADNLAPNSATIGPAGENDAA